MNKLIFLCVLCMAFASCTQDNDATPQSTEGKVRLAFRVVDALQTRADNTNTEAGWDNGWNENKVERVDVFLFDEDGNLHKHIEKEDLNVDNATAYQTLESGLTYTELTTGTYTYYMVANCGSLENFSGKTLGALQEAMIGTPLTCNKKQFSFVMDGQGTLTKIETAKTATLTFDLSRAAVKIRISVKDASASENSIIEQCTYWLCNYVSAGTFVLTPEQTEKFGDGTNQHPVISTEDMTYADVLNYDGTQVVFYSYPNDWFDEKKLVWDEKEEVWTITDLMKEDPIEADRQTYILLKAPYGDEEYYYKVPVNKTIYEGNDAVTFTDAQLKEIRDLYRMKRNYIYDVTVKIDREGGPVTDPVTPAFYVLINDWIQGGDYNIGAGEFVENG
ncbi:fimbrial protein [uncultured Bacteroides sp.]|uniref:fimbrial protein n=1 Tax=uncultured Bacteroides sp. TaxID=162156 RepID=UPI0026060200|nr:fimbrial protein [uncultured Bacteroides sp.]